MANIKFSQFTTNAGIDGNPPVAVGSGNSFLVGFDTTANSNNRWSFPQIAAGLSAHIPTIYSGDSNITSNRTIGLLSSNYLKIQDSSNVDLLSISEDGAFTLGLGATNNGNNPQNSVAIGNSATIQTNASSAVAIGNSASANSFGVSIGGSAIGSSGGAVAIGTSTTTGQSSNAIAIGYDADISNFKHGSIAIGSYINASGANSITFNATNVNSVNASTDDTFGVYMTSNTTPDFKVVGGGESVLNTSLQITGQAYAGLETGVGIDSIDFNDGNVQEVTLVASTETDFDPTNFKAGATYILKLIQPTGGNATIAWESTVTAVNWPGGTPPTLSTAAGAVDIVTLICTSEAGNGTFYANATLNFS